MISPRFPNIQRDRIRHELKIVACRSLRSFDAQHPILFGLLQKLAETLDLTERLAPARCCPAQPPRAERMDGNQENDGQGKFRRNTAREFAHYEKEAETEASENSGRDGQLPPASEPSNRANHQRNKHHRDNHPEDGAAEEKPGGEEKRGEQVARACSYDENQRADERDQNSQNHETEMAVEIN